MRRPSRRAVLLGAGGVVLAGAAAVAVPLLETSQEEVPALLSRRPFTVAHRGSSRDWPEMSAYAYSRSVQAGARALEISVSRTADGAWFGLHDGTLDRTSGTTGWHASRHTWEEVSRYRISPASTRFPTQPSRPYLRLEDFLRLFAPASVVFVDPKAVPSKHYPELLALLRRAVQNPAASLVAKSDSTNTAWASLARGAGLRTWGFYYGRTLTSHPGQLASTQGSWDLLGLDWEAHPEQWAQVTALGKPVIGHIIASEQERAIALRRGAAGVIVSDLLRVAP